MGDIEPVVIDLGSGKVRAGFGGGDAPASEFDNIVGNPRNPGVLIGLGSKASYVGDDAQSQRGVLSLSYPIEHGIVQNWDALEKVLHHTIFNGLRVAPEEHPIMLSEHPINPKRDRERLCQMMFENFAVPAYFSGLSPIMAGYSCGTTTSCVVNIGDGVISVTPICWGYISRKTIRRVNFGGRDLTNYMHRMLADRGYYLNRSSDFQTVRDLKEKLCYVALDYEAELQTSQNYTKLEKEYEMPDGQTITLNSERFRCHEALFKPSMVGLETPGIHELVYDAIMSCDRDYRWSQWNNIVLAGGVTCVPGFADRLHKDLTALAPDKVKVKVIAMPERKYATWIGGSILSSLTTFQQMWISKEEYDESGPSLVNRKCYDGY